MPSRVDSSICSISLSRSVISWVVSLICRMQSKAEEQAYHKLIVTRLKEQRERRSESLAKKRAVRQASQASRDLSQASKQ